MKTRIADHGYVEFIEAWGTGKAGYVVDSGGWVERDYECGIIEAARQSTQGSFRGWDEDRKLLGHLYRNRHDTPFEFAGMVIEVQAPIFVFREWHRHRTQSYNEMSARYAPLPDFKYTPCFERLMQVNIPTTNKQAGNVGGITLSAENAMKWLTMLEHAYAVAGEAYRFGLAVGIEKGLARLPMPVSNYSRMRAAANLRNWRDFISLRTAGGAQWEIRQYANAVADIVKEQFPETHALWLENDRA